MTELLTITEEMKREAFSEQVKFGEHPRFGKNANWKDLLHPAGIETKTYWYAYETGDGRIAIKYNTENIFGPDVYEYIDYTYSFEETIFQYWIK